MIVGVNAAMHHFAIFYRVTLNQPGFSCFFFFFLRPLYSAKVKKRLYPLPLCTQCHPQLLIHMHTQTGKHMHRQQKMRVKDRWDLRETLL